ncbi:calponin homology domain-containing protein [Scheffersomyces amazonensis]|uniref:calponin homology domain-containing protein n=1 Tax=Scheffersomyces amazonensis TaxID=1078765 RepID=UPI00315D054C
MSNYMNYDRYGQPTKLEQNASTNLDQDVNNSRIVKYHERQNEIKKYLDDILTPHYTTLLINKFGKDWQNYDLMDILKDGEVLCKLGLLLSSSVTPNPCSKFKNSKIAFIQMENISFFLSLCQIIKLKHDEIFQTVDLYENKDPYQIIITLMAFSRLVNDIDPTIFKYVVGPKPVKIKPQVPVKPFALRS